MHTKQPPPARHGRKHALSCASPVCVGNQGAKFSTPGVPRKLKWGNSRCMLGSLMYAGDVCTVITAKYLPCFLRWMLCMLFGHSCWCKEWQRVSSEISLYFFINCTLFDYFSIRILSPFFLSILFGDGWYIDNCAILLLRLGTSCVITLSFIFLFGKRWRFDES